MMDELQNKGCEKWTSEMFVSYGKHCQSWLMWCGMCIQRFVLCVIVSVLIMVFAWRVQYMCYIYHDFMSMVSLYRRVFDFTVSNVSYVTNLYFSKDYPWHVCWHVDVSRVQNQAMYTLWWMMCEIGDARNEHEKCSFWIVCTIHAGGMPFVWRIFVSNVDLAYAIHTMYVLHLPWFIMRDFSI